MRYAGQSIQDEMDRIFESAVMDNAVILILIFIMWGFAVLVWLFPTPPQLLVILMSMCLAGAALWCVPKMVRAYRELQQLKLGRDGERAVAESLDLLRGDGNWVLHDILAEGFNTDHVVVGVSGVYAIETKTMSKPNEGDARIKFDGERVQIGRFEPDRDPVKQARAQAAWMRTLLEDMTGRRYPIRPVVVFPGWFVEREHRGASSDVWVLEPKALRAFIAHEPVQMSDADVRMIVNRLKRYMRPVARSKQRQ